MNEQIQKLRNQRFINCHLLLPKFIAEKRSPQLFYYANETKKQKFESLSLAKMKGSKSKNVLASLSSTHSTQSIPAQKEKKEDKVEDRTEDKGRKGPHCPRCGRQVFEVSYFKNHICLFCRKRIVSQNGLPILLFLKEGEIVCLGEIRKPESRVDYTHVDPLQLYLDGKKVMATFAGKDELIVIYR